MSEWKESLSEDLRAHSSLEKFEGVDSLAKSYVELQTKLGDRNYIPTKDATDEQWQDFYSKVTPEEYELEFGDLNSVKANEILTDDFKTQLKGMGLTNKQAQGMLNMFRGVIESKETNIVKANETNAAAMKEAFEKEFRDEEVRTKSQKEVDDFVRDKFGETYLNAIKDTAAYKNVDNFKAMLKQARRAAPDPGVNDNSSSSNNKSTKDDLMTERQQLLTGIHPVYKDAALNPRSKAHADATKRMGLINQTLSTY